MKPEKISEFTTSRLSVYLRCLKQLEVEGTRTISSHAFADRFGLNSAQIRKDLAYFGEFGVRGVGYDVAQLRRHLADIMGLNHRHRVGIIGAGNLGMALANYKNWMDSSFAVVALFDNNPARIGKTSKNSQGIKIYDVKDFNQIVTRENIELIVLAVPREAAQDALNLAIKNNIKAILNFAPALLEAPDDVKIKTVDLTVSLESLAYFLARPNAPEGGSDK